MKYTAKEVLRFLFPEIQIVDVIKEEGFIAKKSEEVSMTSKKKVQRNAVGKPIQSTSQLGQTIGQNFPKKNKADGKGNYVSKTKTFESTKINKKFVEIEENLSANWIASTETISALCQSFKRPYIMGYDTVKPKNGILLIGNESHGKVTGITAIGKILKQKGLIQYDAISQIDMGNYPTNAEDGILLSDLYKALYSHTDIIVFQNIDKVSYQGIEILLQLMQNGKYQLQNRYVMQNNMLVESTSALNIDTVSEIKANGKFFVFTSNKSKDKTLEHLGNTFVQLISDIIVLPNFGNEETNRIVAMLFQNLTQKVRKQLQMQLIPKDSCFVKLRESFSQKTGIKGLQEYIESEIYKPLAEHRMKNSVIQEQEVEIFFEEKYKIKIENNIYDLSSYIKKYDSVALDKIKEELEEVIGLNSVKQYVLNLENNLTVQKMREQKGLKAADISMHMIFTGNPGTGKTTIARIVARYLKAIGVLSSGHLREVSRSDMVGQYMGETAKLTAGLVESALGGVLFVDEAYSLVRDKNDTFGVEAVDALIKGIEDNRDDLVVILAGYSEEMEEFLETNPGLKSRFPNVINFEDYTPEEMLQIAKVTAVGKGYILDEACQEPLLAEFERKQIKGRNDGGNGRLVRNLIEAAILVQSQRIIANPTQELEILTLADFGFDKKKEFHLEEELEKVIGLESVKEFVRTQYNVIIAREKRKRADLKVDTTQSLNMVFTGNPGTGKTTMARVVAEMFHSMGLLKSGHLIETDKSGLIAEYVGQTAKKTEHVFKSALGGVLFIDEAYAITSDKSSFGQECIDTLVKLIEDYRGEILIILAGYAKEMSEFMKANSGLESRFPLVIEFPDYSAEELFQIGKGMISGRGFVLSDESELVFKNTIHKMKQHTTASSGNGRMVRNFIEQIIRNQSARIATTEVTEKEMATIEPLDIVPESRKDNTYNLEEELSKVVGLESVKNYIKSLNARLKIQEERKKQGLKVDSTQTLHMIFMGNPGTGKTMMARTVANVLYNMGVITTNKMVETDRSGLVAGYVGQTAVKTKEVIESALDGVLFIDEAYSLAQGGNNDFGREAIDTLVKMMDDNRDRLVVILAGYNEDMGHFLDKNVGLKSRFPNIIEFSDYSTDELMHIAKGMYNGQGYVLSEDAMITLKGIFEKAKHTAQFGNGRYVRNVFERSLNKQALRLSKQSSMETEDLVRIKAEDIEEV